MKKIALVLLPCLALAGFFVAQAIGAGETTGTNSVCATATALKHTVGVDGTTRYTIPAVSTTKCNTTTFTIPTSTVTSTVTDPGTTSSTTPSTSTDTTPSTTSTTPSTTSTTTTTTPPPPPPTTSGLAVKGSTLVDKNGTKVQLHGVNVSGTEYACIQGWGIWDSGTPASPPPTASLTAWHINFVRVLLNEDCWLGINPTGSTATTNPAYYGANYRNAIVNWVNQLHAAGIYTEIVDMWNAPDTQQAHYQDNAPDEDHSPDMWASMAKTFAGDPDTILSPTGETTVSFNCLFNGCPSASDPSEQPQYGGSDNYTSAGLVQGVQVMRSNGFTGPIALECRSYANRCDEGSNGSWLQYAKQINDSQIMAEVHIYGGNGFQTAADMDAQYKPIIQAGYPLFLGETGERYDYSDCPSTSFISQYLPWMDQNGGVGYAAWTWDTWGACSTGALITDWNGTPQVGDGQYVHDYYTQNFPADPPLP